MNRPLRLVSVGLLFASVTWAGEPTGPSNERAVVSKQQALRKLIDEAVNWYQLLPSAASDTPMEPLVVLRYVNHARESSSGTLVLWLHQGRPEAAATVYDWYGRIVHAFVSLSRGNNMIARDGQRVVWHPAKPGVEFRPVPDAPQPADTTAGRLWQMKKLSRHFGSTLLGWKEDNSDREALRLLATPLYRYKSRAPDLLDGVVFAFVQGTDPETLLMLEAARVADRYEWQYGFARQTNGALDGRYRGKVVWTAKKDPGGNASDCFTSPSKPIPGEVKN